MDAKTREMLLDIYDVLGRLQDRLVVALCGLPEDPPMDANANATEDLPEAAGREPVVLTGARLKAMRIKTGASQRELARAVGMCDGAISYYEMKKLRNHPIPAKNVVKVTKALYKLARSKGITL